MVEAKTPRTGALKVQVEDIDRRIVSISQVVEALQGDIEEIKKGIVALQEQQNKSAEAPDAREDMLVVIGRLGTTEEKVEVLEQYIKTFNVFLNQSMITNSVDSAAEETLNEVIDKL